MLHWNYFMLFINAIIFIITYKTIQHLLYTMIVKVFMQLTKPFVIINKRTEVYNSLKIIYEYYYGITEAVPQKSR